MTKVQLQREDDEDRKIIAELDLDAIPRIGESICIVEDSDLPVDHAWRVSNVAHVLRTIHSQMVEHIVFLTIRHLNDHPLDCYIEWQDEATRPSWISDEMRMVCDIAPRQGDIIQIAVNDERYLNEDAPVAIVEVIAVIHTTMLIPDDEPMIEANQTTFAAVVRNVDRAPTGEIQRIMASRRN